jgi:hypothetical protein
MTTVADKKPAMKMAPPSLDQKVIFQSTGPILTTSGHKRTNDHSTLYDVNGKEVWLHNEKHTYTDGEVTMTYTHAVDNNLVDPVPDEPVKEPVKEPETVSAYSNTAPPGIGIQRDGPQKDSKKTPSTSE